MSSFRRQSGSLWAYTAICTLTLLLGCGPTRYAYFQPQRNTIQRLSSTTDPRIDPVDTLTPPSVSAATTEAPATPVLTLVISSSTGMAATRSDYTLTQHSSASLPRHRNPDSYHNQRFSRLFHTFPAAHVAPRIHSIDRNSAGRKTYKMALIALGFAVLSFGSMFITAGGTLMWVLGVTLPLTATLLGVASLTTIKRNQDRYRGKGWAMAAIMIGTGALGLALVALAALSVSETISR